MDPLIYGKDKTERIVSIEPGDSTAVVFRELEDGTIKQSEIPINHYILFTEQHSPKMKRLAGNQPYKWLYETDSRAKFRDVLSASYKKHLDMHVIRDPKEAVMVKDGLTYFKGLKVSDVSVLSFDIETTGLVHDETSKVLLISNTFRSKGKIERMLFALDDYDDQQSMLTAWCAWVIGADPSIVLGHNIFGYDLPYIAHVSDMVGVKLMLGRDCSLLKFADRTSQFRKDDSQVYDYKNALIYGREIVDTYFLAMKYDTSARREYESYGLKSIIQHELESLKEKKKSEPKKFTDRDREFMERLSHGGNRVFYDASKIKDNWHIPEEREKIKAYAIDDADDALTLYDLMIPSLFYYTQSVPMSFQSIINRATGSQINSLMVRAYLQQGHSIAKASETIEYQGAISFGIPGFHKNVFKIDVASLYPSIIRQFRVYDEEKDPQGLFLKIVDTFTDERLKNKALAETDRMFDDMSSGQKIVINSGYGMLGAPGLPYNSPKKADFVCNKGREILKLAIKFFTGTDYVKALPVAEEDESDDAA